MANNTDFRVIAVKLGSLKLDRDNPRISLRAAADDRACIERLADGKEGQLYALAKDISESQLGIEPIVVLQDGADSWIVKDGNRRVAVLKMLSNPLLAPDALRSRIERLVARGSEQPESIEVYTSDSEEIVSRYIHRRHTGSGDGEGQLDWDAVEQAFFELSIGVRGQYDIAARVLRYAQNEGVTLGPGFPISTMARFLSRQRVTDLGIEDISADPPKLLVDADIVRSRLNQMINDLSSGRIHVRRGGESGSVFETSSQDAYIQSLIQAYPVQPPRSGDGGGDAAGGSKGGSGCGNGSARTAVTEVSPGSTVPTSPSSVNPAPVTGNSNATVPVKPSWDRSKVIQRVGDHGVKVPQGHRKARNIIAELRSAVLSRSVIGPGMLVRAFLELSVSHYLGRFDLAEEVRAVAAKANDRRPGLRHQMEACINHMHEQGLIDRSQKTALVQRTRQDHVSVDTLHAIVHSENFLPDILTLNSFWDDMHVFLNHCWNS